MAGQKFTLTFDANLNVSQMKSALGQIQSTLNGLHLPQNVTKGLQSTFDKLQKEIQAFEVAASKDITSKTDFKKLETQAAKVTDAFEKLKIQVRDLAKLNAKDLEKLFPQKTTQNIQDATNAVKQYQTNMANATKEVNKAQAAVNKLTAEATKIQGKQVLTGDQYKQLTDNLKVAQQEVNDLDNKLKQLNTQEEQMRGSLSQPNKSSRYRQLVQDIKDVNDQLTTARQNAERLANQKANSITFEKQAKDLADLNAKLAEATNKLNQYKQDLANIQSTGQGGGLKSLLDDIGRLTGMDMSKFSQDTKGAANAIQVYLNQELQKLNNNLHTVESTVNGTSKPFEDLSHNVRDSGNALEQFNTQAREIDQLKSRIQYFFGLNNTINLVKRTMREAYDTIKELDKAMTETAVVTDFSVGDMWAQLPDYTKRANELGVSTKAAYEAATLYYQQGLKTNEVMAMSNETLKMARIAGLDAAVATDRMTNAIRGFNMEINTTNAQRIDDVYSRLAAISASNVDEISTAMTKVASLAHSANMEFETTAAFLAQIIETTRESAETAGTALKTVVARFSEVKKLVSEGELKGSDEEGELIDVNKVSSALRTAGIDLNKYFLGEVGLDDIFMELASKWDSLTTMQQRYIATQAAGSRQQSRFIALMSDYARTQELVGEAYKANGAAAKQFEKTQESLESKLARLKNAWNEFAMGIFNSDLVKIDVDLLTNILNGINALTSGFGLLDKGIGGVINSISKLILLFGSLGAGKTLFSGLTASISNIGLAAAGKAPLDIAKAMSTAAVGANATGTLANLAGRGKGGALLAGFLNPFSGIGNVAKAGWTGAKDLGAAIKSGAWLFGSAGIKGAGAGLTGTAGLVAGAAGIGSIVAALGAVAAAAGVAYIAIKKLYDASPAGQVKIAQKYANALQSVADNAKDQLKEYQSVQDEYKRLSEQVNNSTNVAERSTAIKDRNEYITSLLEQNAAYAEYLSTTFENGEILLTLDEDKLAAAVDKIAEGAVKASAYSSMANAVTAGQQADLYRSKMTGIDLANGIRSYIAGDSFAGFETKTTPLTQEEIVKYTRYQSAIESSKSQMRAYVKSAASELINTDLVSDEVASIMADLISEGFDADKISNSVQAQQRENWWAGEATTAQLKTKYESIFGIGSSEDIEKAEQARAVAFAEVMEQTTEQQIDQLEKYLTGNNHELYEAVLSAAAGTGLINEINLSDFTLDGDVTDLFTALGIHDTQLADLAEATGRTVGSLMDQITAQAKLIKEVQKVNKSKIYEKLLRSGVAIDQATQNYIQSLTPEQAQQISDVVTQSEQFLTPESYQDLLKNIPQLVQSEELTQIQDFFNNFNLDNPINAFIKLKEAEEEAVPDGLFSKFLKEVEEANKAIFNSGNLFQSFIQSNEYGELTEEVHKFIEENNKLTSDKVIELTGKSKSLKAILSDTEVTARGLAKALTLLDAGNAPIEGFTERVLDALSSMEDFDSMLEDITNTIENFDPGRDFGEGSDFLVAQADTLLELINGYEFGNEQTRNIYDLFFGPGAYNQFMSDWGTTGVEEYGELLKAKVNKFQDWAANNSYGFMETFAGNAALGISKIGDFDFKWDSQGRTTQELIKEVQNQAQISREAAEMIIEGFAAQSYDFASELRENDYTQFLQDFTTTAGQTRTITEQELTALGAAFGKTSDQIYADLEKLHDEKGIQIPIRVNWQDENGNPLTGDALIKQFQDSLGNVDLSQYVQNAINSSTGNINADALLSNLQSDGLNPEQASEIADKIASDIDGAMLEKTISVPKLAEDGITITSEDITIAADSLDGLTTAANVALEAVQYELVANKLAESNLSGFENLFNTTMDRIAAHLTMQLGAACTMVDASGVANAITNAGSAAAGNIQSIIASTPFQGTVYLQTVVSGTGSGALGGIVSSYASGNNIPEIQPGWALTGEEAPEIVWNKERGYAYITGANGPEFRVLLPGDRVFNAQETSRILKNSSFAKGGIFNSYATGGYNRKKIEDYYNKKYGGSSGGSSGGGGDGGSDSSTPTVWENDLDWLYNLMEDISELERTQTKLAEKHDRYLHDISKTGRDLYNVTQDQLNNLYTQRDNEIEALTRRRQEMAEQIGISGYSNYVWWNDRDQTIEIDWDAIEAIQDKDTYDEITDLISKVEKIQDQMDTARDTLWDIEGQIKELEDRYLQEFTEFQQRILDAVVRSYQDTIDNLTSLNDTLNDTNTSILESLQKEIEYSRQIRDNTDTENNIADMEARLAYLRRDTTGANEGEVRELERQLNETRQDYTDALIDQQLERLSEANDLAAEQRQQQIALMTEQLEYWQESGALWGEVTQLLADGISEDGSLIHGTELEQILQNAEGWRAMSEQQREVWGNDLITAANQAGAYLLKIAEGFDSLSAGVWAMLPSSSVTSQKLQYATGGMNTKTGWAWLDGTANDPEYVLNARQTDAFLKLADILPSMFGSGNTTTNNLGGNVYVELTMNVGEISNDYDVDRMVDRVKSDIYDASNYRNVNSVNFLR